VLAAVVETALLVHLVAMLSDLLTCLAKEMPFTRPSWLKALTLLVEEAVIVVMHGLTLHLLFLGCGVALHYAAYRGLKDTKARLKQQVLAEYSKAKRRPPALANVTPADYSALWPYNLWQCVGELVCYPLNDSDIKACSPIKQELVTSKKTPAAGGTASSAPVLATSVTDGTDWEVVQSSNNLAEEEEEGEAESTVVETSIPPPPHSPSPSDDGEETESCAGCAECLPLAMTGRHLENFMIIFMSALLKEDGSVLFVRVNNEGFTPRLVAALLSLAVFCTSMSLALLVKPSITFW